jgi:hypothetical protein
LPFFHHLTNGIRSAACSAATGYEKSQSGYSPFMGFSLRHILRLLVLLRKPLYATAKRRIPGTLNDKKRFKCFDINIYNVTKKSKS